MKKINKVNLSSFEKSDPYKFGNLVKDKKLKIPLPDLVKLTAAANKDIAAIDNKIDKINSIHVSKLESKDIDFVHDLTRIKFEINKVIESFDKTVKTIKSIWSDSKPVKIVPDERRVSDVIYLINFEYGYKEFEQVDDVFPFVDKHMKNTLKYLSKFGCVVCMAGDSDSEIWQNHPWSKEIYRKE
jgi:hypothetical protein